MRLLPILLLMFSCLAWGGEWSTTANGCRVWNPFPKINETVTWSGGCPNGYIEGWGEVEWIVDGKTTSWTVGDFKNGTINGLGTLTLQYGKYVGELNNSVFEGRGTFFFSSGAKYDGEFKGGTYYGQGILIQSDGARFDGIWENNNFVRETKVNLSNINNNVATNPGREDIARERQQLAEERRRLEEDKRQREQAKSSQRINLQVTHTQPNTDGSFFIEVKTNIDTASLQIDGKEEGGKSDGNYIIKRIARVGSASSFRIVATDVYGNTETKSITVSRAIVDSKVSFEALNPGQVKQQPTRDAVAIIIGIANYKTLPKAA
jgi:hypothetical protein